MVDDNKCCSKILNFHKNDLVKSYQSREVEYILVSANF